MTPLSVLPHMIFEGSHASRNKSFKHEVGNGLRTGTYMTMEDGWMWDMDRDLNIKQFFECCYPYLIPIIFL